MAAIDQATLSALSRRMAGSDVANPPGGTGKVVQEQPPSLPFGLGEAISRRIGQVPPRYPYEAGQVPHVELGSLLDMIINQAEKDNALNRITSNIPSVADSSQIDEDMPQFDWQTMGNRTRGVTNPLSGRLVIQMSPKKMPEYDKFGRPIKVETT